MAEVHAVGVTLRDQRDERLDPLLIGVEVLDVEAVAAESSARVCDRTQVLQVVAVAGVRDHDPGRVDPGLREHVQGRQARFRQRVRVDHHGSAGLDARSGDRGQDPRHVADHAVHLHRAFQEGGLDARVVDPFAKLPHKELDDRIVRPVGQEARQLEEGVDTGRDHDVEIDLGVDPLDARDVPAEPERGGVDECLYAAVAQPLQPRDRVGDPHLLVPVAQAPDMAEVDERFGVEHEHVLVHQRRPELGELNGPANGFNGAAHRCETNHGRGRVLSERVRRVSGGKGDEPGSGRQRLPGPAQSTVDVDVRNASRRRFGELSSSLKTWLTSTRSAATRRVAL